MNNLMSYCGLVDAKIRASDKDLPLICCSDSYLSGIVQLHKIHCVEKTLLYMFCLFKILQLNNALD